MFLENTAKVEEIINSKATNQEKIESLNNIKNNIRRHFKKDVLKEGAIATGSGIAAYSLYNIDHSVFQAILEKSSVDISALNLAMFGAECGASLLSFLYTIFFLQTLEDHVTDISLVNSYQKRLKAHK